ncbi:MAG: NAD(P)-dependent oxidoreductase [Planctomycetota bacterium]|nr:MAG: NAD(P)-dependent oxidoreductase [Planctomycetota bacterium]
MARVGLIGVGLLGTALAERLLAAGHVVVGFDLDAARRQALVAAGGIALESAARVAEQCDTLVFSLPNSSIVAQVVASIKAELRSRHLLVDTTTGDPQAVESLAAQLASCDIDYIDATILGSSQLVRDGQAIVMVGGEDEAVGTCRELLACFGREAFHVGPTGAGSRMKLVVNLVLGLHRAVLAEGLTLAKALDLDPASALAILKAGAAYSAVMDTKGEKMLTGDFAPQARLSQHLKDVRLLLAAAERSATSLPLSESHRILLERAEAAGYGEADNSAILRAFDS